VPQLDIERIALGALEVADTKGAAGFTIRAVAEELGVSPMAIYHYVHDKAELVALLIDRMALQAAEVPHGGTWRDNLLSVANFMRRSAMDHPALFELQQAYRVWTPSIYKVVELWMGLWRKSGLPPEKALLAANVSGMAIGGLLWQESQSAGDDPSLEQFNAFQDASKLLNLGLQSGEMFNIGVRAIIEGLYVQLSAVPEKSP